MNLYGYANGDPVNFSDPFGLCVADDDVCHELVRKLRAVGGETLDWAADIFDGYQGRVILRADLPGDMGSSSDRFVQLGTGTSMTDLGPIQAGEGDLLVLAVHEAGHLDGTGSEYGPEPSAVANFEILLGLEQKAFKELGAMNYDAPLSYLRLRHYGRPVEFDRPPPPAGGN